MRNAKLNSIEAARGLAALSVALMHAGSLMNTPHFSGHVGMGGLFGFGYVGVDFFFVLSGFIITWVHFGEIGHPRSVPRYLWRRFSRIYPIYWIILVLVIAATVAARLATDRPVDLDLTPGDIPATVLLLMTGEPRFIGVAWTLQFEVIFYLAFCLLLVNGWAGAAIFAAWGAAALAQSFGIVAVGLPLHLGSAHCLQFLLGVAVAAAARRWAFEASGAMLALALTALVGAVVFEVAGPYGRHSASGRLALGLASAAVLVVLVGLERRDAIRTPGWLVTLGNASYSIYLGHILFIGIAYMALLKLGLYHRLPEALVYAAGLASALAGTLLIGLYVELPMVRTLKARLLGSRPVPVT